ncbi:MAG: hypothetical protein ACPGSO_00945 [Vicingaceae bacterium]
MKLKYIPFLTVLFAALLTFSACSKKDRSPTLKITVQDSNKNLLQGASIRVWPTDEVPYDTTATGELIPNGGYNKEYTKEGTTDVNGEAVFSFPASAVLDVDVTYSLATDSTPVLLEGHKVVKIETVRQKEEENIFEETVVVE